jgi:hypothetical protein
MNTDKSGLGAVSAEVLLGKLTGALALLSSTLQKNGAREILA